MNTAPARPDYYVQTGSMFENPYGVPRDEIVRFILSNPPEVVAQVVFGKYVENSGLVFTAELIERMIDRPGKWYGKRDGKVWQRSFTGDYFLHEPAVAEARAHRDRYGYEHPGFSTGVDFGRQTDFTVITTLDCRWEPARLVYYKRLNKVPWESIYREVGVAVMHFGPHVLCDATGPAGDVVMDELEARLFCPIHQRTFLHDAECPKGGCDEHFWIPLSCCSPFYFTARSKKELAEHLRNVLSFGYDPTTPDVEFGRLRIPPIAQLVEEVTFYAWDDKKLVTDAFFSLCLAAWDGLEETVPAATLGSPFGSY